MWYVPLKFLGFAPPSTDALSTRLPSHLYIQRFWVGTLCSPGLHRPEPLQWLLATNHPSRLYGPQGLNFPAEYMHLFEQSVSPFISTWPTSGTWVRWVYDRSRSGEKWRKDNSILSRPCINIISEFLRKIKLLMFIYFQERLWGFPLSLYIYYIRNFCKNQISLRKSGSKVIVYNSIGS